MMNMENESTIHAKYDHQTSDLFDMPDHRVRFL